MISNKDRAHLQTALKTNKIVWYALVGSVPVYVIACHLLKGQVGGAEVEQLREFIPMLRTILMVVAAFTLFITPIIRKLIIKSARDKRIYGPGAQAEPYVRDAIAKYMTGLIVSLALIESVAIYGFILFMMGDDYATLYAFSIASLVFMGAYFPKLDALEKIAMELKREGIQD